MFMLEIAFIILTEGEVARDENRRKRNLCK